jgi:hypothetical protein
VKLPRNFLALVQIVEYLRAFLMARLALSRMQVLTIISGAFGLFRRELVLEVGGYSHGTVGEDMELVVKLHRLMRDRKLPYRSSSSPIRSAGRSAGRCAGAGPAAAPLAARRARDLFPAQGHAVQTRATAGSGSWASARCWWSICSARSWSAGLCAGAVALRLGLLAVEYLLAFLAITFSFGVFVSVATLILEEVELRASRRARDLAC